MLPKTQSEQIEDTFKQIETFSKQNDEKIAQSEAKADKEEQNEMEVTSKCECGCCRKKPHIHNLKIKPQYFRNVVNGTKTFETRFNDRDFKVGDLLQLEEFDDKGYTGKYIFVEVIYMLDDPQYCKDNYVTMSIERRLERGAVL